MPTKHCKYFGAYNLQNTNIVSTESETFIHLLALGMGTLASSVVQCSYKVLNDAPKILDFSHFTVAVGNSSWISRENGLGNCYPLWMFMPQEKPYNTAEFVCCF